MLLVCAPVSACGPSDGGQNLVNPVPSTTITPRHSTSCSWLFLHEDRAPDLSHHVSLLHLCARSPSNRTPWGRPSHTPLSSPINRSRLNKAQCLFNVCVAWIHISHVKLPSPGWGTAELEGPTGVSRGRVQTVGSRWSKRTGGGGAGLSGISSLTARTLQCPWSQVSQRVWKYITELEKSFLFEPNWGQCPWSSEELLCWKAWGPAQSSTSSKLRTYVNMTGCTPSRPQEADLIHRQQDSSSWWLGREPYLPEVLTLMPWGGSYSSLSSKQVSSPHD